MKTKDFKPGDKVKVDATNEQLESFGMDNAKINRQLRKYESTVSEVLVKGGFPDEDGNIHKSIVLDSTFIIPACYLKFADEEENKNEEEEEEEEEQEEEVKETEETEEEKTEEDEDANKDTDFTA